MKNKIIIFVIAIVILFAIIGLGLYNKNKVKEENKTISEEISEQKSEEGANNIEEEEEENTIVDPNMYQEEEEYDGRKIVQIKPDVQYETALAGILKNGKPKESEIKELLKNRPTKSGVWVSKQSRDKFLKFLEKNNITGYEFDEEGYLKEKQGKTNNNITNAINSNNLYILDIAGKSYDRDELTGKIIEYPFEEMEPDQATEIYSVKNSTIIVITTNSNGILSDKEILQDILLNIK